MFGVVYNIALLLVGLLSLPKLLWHRIRFGKYRESSAMRLGRKLPDLVPNGIIASPSKAKTIWIHAVSVGETRAVAPLFKKMRSAYPEANIIVSNITETGHAEAKKSLKEADAHFYLPLDFSWIIKGALKKYRPDILILVESDFWYHLLSIAKKMGSKVLLVNGKISSKSYKRFSYIPFFTKRIFANIDHLCVQSQRFKTRFSALGIADEKITPTGNLKLDASVKNLDIVEKIIWQEELGIAPKDPVLVIGSTHAPEEEQLLSSLDCVLKEIPNLKILLVPRHPERFGKVKEFLKHQNHAFISYSERSLKTGQERIILIDAMGILNTCYQLATVAIVAGSFTDKVGGHNIFEPILFGVPTLFGPHMYTQPDLVDLAVSSGAGREVNLENLPQELLSLLKNPAQYLQMQNACIAIAHETKGSTERTWNILDSMFHFFLAPGASEANSDRSDRRRQ